MASSLSEFVFAATVQGHWHPGIGDPTFLGWATVAAYVVAMLLCGRAALREPRITDAKGMSRTKRTVFWAVLTALLLALAINKQLDLQTWFTELGRGVARRQGWYENRQALQFWFIWGIAATAAVVLASATWIAYRAHRRFRFALIGIFYLLSFIVIRAASFHHMDHFLGIQVAHFRMNHVLELGGIFITGASALVPENGNREPGNVSGGSSPETSEE